MSQRSNLPVPVNLKMALKSSNLESAPTAPTHYQNYVNHYNQEAETKDKYIYYPGTNVSNTNSNLNDPRQTDNYKPAFEPKQYTINPIPVKNPPQEDLCKSKQLLTILNSNKTNNNNNNNNERTQKLEEKLNLPTNGNNRSKIFEKQTDYQGNYGKQNQDNYINYNEYNTNNLQGSQASANFGKQDSFIGRKNENENRTYVPEQNNNIFSQQKIDCQPTFIAQVTGQLTQLQLISSQMFDQLKFIRRDIERKRAVESQVQDALCKIYDQLGGQDKKFLDLQQICNKNNFSGFNFEEFMIECQNNVQQYINESNHPSKDLNQKIDKVQKQIQDLINDQKLNKKVTPEVRIDSVEHEKQFYDHVVKEINQTTQKFIQVFPQFKNMVLRLEIQNQPKERIILDQIQYLVHVIQTDRNNNYSHVPLNKPLIQQEDDQNIDLIGNTSRQIGHFESVNGNSSQQTPIQYEKTPSTTQLGFVTTKTGPSNPYERR